MNLGTPTCARCGGSTYPTLVKGMSVDKCEDCGAVTLSEADLHEVVGSIDTEDAPTEWAPTDETERTQLLDDHTHTSEDAPTAVGGDLPFNIESQPPPPRRQRTPEPAPVFAAPPMLTEEFEVPPNFDDIDRTEEAPRLTMPVRGAAMLGEPQIDLSSLREAAAPPPARDMGPAPASDFNDEPTRPAYPIEGTLEPAEEVGSYLMEREDRRQTRVFLLISVAAVMAIGLLGIAAYGLTRGPSTPSGGSAELAQVITSSDGRVAVEVDEPSVADLLPPEPVAPKPKPQEIRVTRTAPQVGPTRVVRAVPVVVPVTAPKPAPAAPAPSSGSGGGSYSALVGRGWSTVSSDPATAADAFTKALSLRPGDPDASYGLGYALWRQEKQSQALPHLCLALRTGGVDTQREVNGILARSDLSCD